MQLDLLEQEQEQEQERGLICTHVMGIEGEVVFAALAKLSCLHGVSLSLGLECMSLGLERGGPSGGAVIGFVCVCLSLGLEVPHAS